MGRRGRFYPRHVHGPRSGLGRFDISSDIRGYHRRGSHWGLDTGRAVRAQESVGLSESVSEPGGWGSNLSGRAN